MPAVGITGVLHGTVGCLVFPCPVVIHFIKTHSVSYAKTLDAGEAGHMDEEILAAVVRCYKAVVPSFEEDNHCTARRHRLKQNPPRPLASRRFHAVVAASDPTPLVASGHPAASSLPSSTDRNFFFVLHQLILQGCLPELLFPLNECRASGPTE